MTLDRIERKSDHLHCLDGLKGICACIIAFVWHYRHFTKPPIMPFYRVFKVGYNYGYLLVELFFMLSGFGMMMGYGDRIIRHEMSFQKYIIKRLRKLYPLFLTSTIIVVLLELLIYNKLGDFFIYRNFDLYHFVLNLLLLQNGALETKWSFNSPSWVISVLIILYVALYGICYWAKEKRIVYYIFSCCIILGSVLIINSVDLPVFNVLMGRGIACFSIGVVLHGLYEAKYKYHGKRIAYFGMIFLLAVYYFMRTGKNEFIGNVTMLMVLGIAPMIICSVLFLPWISKLFSMKLFLWLGKISIAIYLMHFPVQCIMICFDLYLFHIDFTSKIVWVLYVMLTILVSSVYTFIISKRYEPALIRVVAVMDSENRHY